MAKKRFKMSNKASKKLFTKTASKIHKKNVLAGLTRGGRRL